MFNPNPVVIAATDTDVVEVDGHPMSLSMYRALPDRMFSPEVHAFFMARFAASHHMCHCGGAANANVNGTWLCFDHGGEA